ncbi:importin-11-like [Styela clava]
MPNTDELIHALKCATDQNPAVLKPAEDWLQSHECDETFYIILSQIAHTTGIEWTVRWIAVVYLKNGIDKYWRSYASGSITSENKAKIKSNLLQCMEEPINQIAVQSAVVIAKIARFDYPGEWNDLIPILMLGISSSKNLLHQSRCILTLKHVLKMISSKRLPHAKKVFHDLCKSIFQDVFQYWMTNHSSTKAAILDSQKLDISVVKNLTDNLCSLTKMVRYMIQEYNMESIEILLNSILKNLFETIEMLKSCISSLDIHENCFKTAISIVKMLQSLLLIGTESYQLGAQRVMGVLCNQIHTYILESHSSNDDNGRKFIVKCMNTCKCILDNSSFIETFSSDRPETNNIAAQLEKLFHFLVLRYLPLGEEDLAFWEEDAENFCNEEVGECWKFNLRPSAEILALTLLKKFPDILVPSLLSMLRAIQDIDIHSVSTAISENNPILQSLFDGCSSPLECMLRKEAVYYMIGLGVYEVLDIINFEEWLVNKLLPEIKSIQSDSHSKLLHRRVLWLISQWAEVKPSDELRPILYGFVVSSLNRTFDMAVRLTASSTIQFLLDDFEFDISLFKEHQDSCFEGLYNLLSDAENCDTKMRVLNVFAFLIERLGPLVLPYEQKISNIIPPVWEHAVRDNHDMLKCAIMSTMSQFIYALKENSSSVSHLTLPLVQESTDLNNKSHIYLLEDGLDLWLAALQNCGEPNAGLFNIFPNVLGLLEYSSETIKTCFLIIEAYVILFRDNLIAKYGSIIGKSFINIATDVRNECLVLMSNLVLTVFQVMPKDATLPCMQYCKDIIRNSFHEKDSILLSANLTLVAHILLVNPGQFWQLIQLISTESGENFAEVAQGFLKVWCENMDAIVDIDKKKLSALALISTLSALTDFPFIAECFADIVCVLVQVLYDVCDEHQVDSLVNDADQDVFETKQEQEECAHDKRKRLLRKSSIVTNTSLPQFASQKFNFLKVSFAEQFFINLMSTVDSQTVSELQSFLS